MIKLVLAILTVRLVLLLRVGRVEVITPKDDGSMSVLPRGILQFVLCQ